MVLSQLLCQFQKRLGRYLVKYLAGALVDDLDDWPPRLRVAGEGKLAPFAHQFRPVYFVDSRHDLADRHILFVRWRSRGADRGTCADRIDSRYLHDLPSDTHFDFWLRFSRNYMTRSLRHLKCVAF